MSAQKALSLPRTGGLTEAVIPVLSIRQVKVRPGNHIFVPMPRDNFAPAIACGDFVVVDIDRRDPEIGALVWLRFAAGDPTFAVLRGAFPKSFADGSHGMSVSFGGQTVSYLDGRKERWPMGDNIPLEHLRTIIAGHVVGVLGRDDSAFNWGAL
jgi:hypothetical protein